LSARAVLRTETRAEHDRVDAAFSVYDLSSPDGYRGFLMRQAAAHLPVERALDAAGVAEAVADWPARRRGAQLCADLAELGAGDVDEAGFAGFATPAEALGGLYVLEGSRLGGAMLVKQVGEGLPRRFLGEGSSAGWRALLAVLEAKLTSPQAIDEAVKGARAVFGCFEAAAGRRVEN